MHFLKIHFLRCINAVGCVKKRHAPRCIHKMQAILSVYWATCLCSPQLCFVPPGKVGQTLFLCSRLFISVFSFFCLRSSCSFALFRSCSFPLSPQQKARASLKSYLIEGIRDFTKVVESPTSRKVFLVSISLASVGATLVHEFHFVYRQPH